MQYDCLHFNFFIMFSSSFPLPKTISVLTIQQSKTHSQNDQESRLTFTKHLRHYCQTNLVCEFDDNEYPKRPDQALPDHQLPNYHADWIPAMVCHHTLEDSLKLSTMVPVTECCKNYAFIRTTNRHKHVLLISLQFVYVEYQRNRAMFVFELINYLRWKFSNRWLRQKGIRTGWSASMRSWMALALMSTVRVFGHGIRVIVSLLRWMLFTLSGRKKFYEWSC